MHIDETVRQAIKDLRYTLDVWTKYSPEMPIGRHLEVLMGWAEEQVEQADKEARIEEWALTCVLVEGDDVEVAMDLGFISKGARGMVVSFDDKTLDHYPYLVRFKTGRQYVFPRHELKRVR